MNEGITYTELDGVRVLKLEGSKLLLELKILDLRDWSISENTFIAITPIQVKLHTPDGDNDSCEAEAYIAFSSSDSLTVNEILQLQISEKKNEIDFIHD